MNSPISRPAQARTRWFVGESTIALLILVCLCLVGAGLRLYRAGELFGFNGDQGRDLTIVQRMIDTGQPTLLGPGSAVGQFKRGPAYYYLLLPAVWLGGGEPLSAVLFIALADVASIAMVFVLGRALVSTNAGIVAASFYTAAVLPVLVARTLTNPALLPLLSLVMLYALWRMVQGHDLFLLLLVAAWLTALQLHEQVLLLLPVFALAWYNFKVQVPVRNLLYSAVFGFILFAPWLWHEATHESANLKAIVDFVRSLGASRGWEIGIPTASFGLWSTLTTLFGGYSNGAWLNALVGVGVAASWIALALSFRRQSRGAQLLLIYSLAPFFYLFWPGPIYAVNLAILVALPCLLLGYGFDKLTVAFPRWRVPGIALVALLFAMNAYLIYSELRHRQPGYDSYVTVKRVVDLVSNTARGELFAFEYRSRATFEELASPFLYLFRRSGAHVTENADAMRFRVFHPPTFADAEPGVVLNDLKVVGYAPPELLGENLLGATWRVHTPAGRHDLPSNQAEIELVRTSGEQRVNAVQRLSLDPDTTYLATFDCRGELLSGDQRVYILVLDAPGRMLDTFPDGAGFVCPAAGDWVRGAILVQSPRETARGRVLLQNAGEGRALFRNVRLQKAHLKPLY